ncbi:Trm112 family protein [soil metagenome]
MPLDQKLLDILICPNCRGEVEYIESVNVIVCTGECKYRYPVRDDIPVMLIDEAEKPAAEAGEGS